MKLVMFCEAFADHRMAAGLVDRVLREEGPAWVSDLMDVDPSHVREWSHDNQDRPFFDIHAVADYLKAREIRALHGHFGGMPGDPGAYMARNIFSIVRDIARAPRDGKHHDAVFIVWDMDDQGERRRKGLEQARNEAAKLASFRIVYGCPDPEHETWLLATFEPESDEERTLLDELRRELGFCPVREAHLLDATADGAKKNPKRIADKLMGKDPERRAHCLRQPLDKLREIGETSGLRQFLNEVNQQILPMLTQSSRQM